MQVAYHYLQNGVLIIYTTASWVSLLIVHTMEETIAQCHATTTLYKIAVAKYPLAAIGAHGLKQSSGHNSLPIARA
jgi:hypothetical protein